MPEHVRLLSIADRFLEAARDLSSRGGQGWRFPVPHYLAGHAIELTLKAHLVHQGAGEESIKRIGHDLEKALRRAGGSVRDLLTEDQVAAIRNLNTYYAAKELEYTAWGASGRMISVHKIEELLGAATALWNHLNKSFRQRQGS